MSGPAPDISVVIPVYNEEENVAPLWEALRPALDGLNRSWELLLVDDGSTDASLERMKALRKDEPRIRIIKLARNRGQSAAFWCGFGHARADIVVTMDADLQNDPGDMGALLTTLEDADVVIGWRKNRRDPFLKRAASKIANGFRNWITKESVHDVGCSLKAFRREVFAHLYPFKGMHRFYPTLARVAGYRVTEVEVRHHPRTKGKSKYGIWNRLFGPFADCLGVRWMKRRYIGKVEAEELKDE